MASSEITTAHLGIIGSIFGLLGAACGWFATVFWIGVRMGKVQEDAKLGADWAKTGGERMATIERDAQRAFEFGERLETSERNCQTKREQNEHEIFTLLRDMAASISDIKAGVAELRGARQGGNR